MYEVKFSSNSAAYCFPGHKFTKVMEVVKKMKMHRTGQEAKDQGRLGNSDQERDSAKKMGIC